MKKIKLLCLGGGRRVSLYKHLLAGASELGIELEIISAELEVLQPVSVCAKVIKAPKWGEAGFFNWLNDQIELHKVDLVLPLMDAGVTKLASVKNDLPSNVLSFVGGFDVAQIFEDKSKLKKYCMDHSIRVIENTKGKFPKILKPTLGFGGRGHILAFDEEQLKAQLLNNDGSEYIVEDLIKDQAEYTVDGYITRSGKSYFSPRVRLQTSGGEAIRSVTRGSDELQNICSDIFTKLRWYGPLTAQFFLDENNKCSLIEINGRFGGGVINSIVAGLRLDKLIFADFLNINLSQDELIAKEGLIMMRANEEYWSWE